MPVNHIAGVGMVGVFGLYVGGTLVFQDRFDPGDLLRLLEEERIDHVLGSPVQFHMMANHPDFGSRDLSGLKFITWGGAPMAADLVARLHALPGELRTSHGMTELGLYVTYTEPGIDLDTLSRTIGKPHPGFDIRVADATGTVARPGAQGEVQARGGWLLAGYFRDPEATADACTADGWFRTGDVVKVWPDGNLEVVGRTKEMFISGGFNIYPREIEIVIEAHPDVGLVAVLGVPDETFGGGRACLRRVETRQGPGCGNAARVVPGAARQLQDPQAFRDPTGAAAPAHRQDRQAGAETRAVGARRLTARGPRRPDACHEKDTRSGTSRRTRAARTIGEVSASRPAVSAPRPSCRLPRCPRPEARPAPPRRSCALG